MVNLTVDLRRSRDGTLTVRVGRQIEHISTEAKTKGEVFDQVKWAIISKGLWLEDIEVAELIQQAS